MNQSRPKLINARISMSATVQRLSSNSKEHRRSSSRWLSKDSSKKPRKSGEIRSVSVKPSCQHRHRSGHHHHDRHTHQCGQQHRHSHQHCHCHQHSRHESKVDRSSTSRVTKEKSKSVPRGLDEPRCWEGRSNDRSVSTKSRRAIKAAKRSKSSDFGTSETKGDVQRCALCSKVLQLRLQSSNLTQPSKTSDVTVVSSDGHEFYCHSFVLDIWAPHLLAGKASSSVRKEFVIKVYGFNSEVVGACLRLMYGGTVEMLPLKYLDEIMQLGRTYQVSDLKEACFEAASKANLTLANACSLWCFAEIHQLEGLRQRAMRYVFTNLPAIVNDSTGSEVWNEMLSRPAMLLDLFFASSEWTTSKLEPPMNRDREMDELWNSSNGLRRSVGFSDITIKTKEGESFHAHLALISLSAPMFAKWLHEKASKAPDEPAVIDDFDGDVIEEFLRAIYRQEPSSEFHDLADFVLVMACMYDVDHVADACERRIAANQLLTHSIDAAMEMWHEADEHSLRVMKAQCYRFFYDKADTLKQHNKWKKFADENPLMLREMIEQWTQFRQLKA